MSRDRLIFVYNADGGVFSAVADAIHKIVSPATYPCSLCAVSYGAVSMKPEWRAFLQSLAIETLFHHRDDFARAWPDSDIDLPAVLLARGGTAPQVVIDAATLNALPDLAALIHAVKQALDSSAGAEV